MTSRWQKNPRGMPTSIPALVATYAASIASPTLAGTGSNKRGTSLPVMFIADVLHPVHGFTVQPFLNGDVRHRGCLGGAVPVLLAGREPDHVARTNVFDRPAPALRESAARRHEQRLPERMRVPRGSGAGLERDAGADRARGIRRREQRIDAHRAGEPVGRTFAGWL